MKVYDDIGFKNEFLKKAKKYDYRVAYFKRTLNTSSIGYFTLPSLIQINPNILDNESVRSMIMQAQFKYSWTLGVSPGQVLTGDQHIFGDAGFFQGGLQNSRLRPSGINAWPSQPTTTQISLVAGNSVKATFNKI